MNQDVKALEDALQAGPTGAVPGDSTWVAVCGSHVMLDSPRPVWARIASCDRDQTSAYIAACSPDRIRRLLDYIRKLEQEVANGK